MDRLQKLPKPIRRTVRPQFGGERCVFDDLAEFTDAHSGLTRLCRDKLGRKTTYYIRWGIDSQGTARGGGQPYARARDALRDWNAIVERATAEVGR
jgi:hypothetical protein